MKLRLRNTLCIIIDSGKIAFQTDKDNVMEAFNEYSDINKRMGIELDLKYKYLDLIDNTTGNIIDFNMKTANNEWAK